MNDITENPHICASYHMKNSLMKSIAYAMTDCDDKEITLIEEFQSAIHELKHELTNLEEDLDKLQKKHTDNTQKAVRERARFIWTLSEIFAAVCEGFHELNTHYLYPDMRYHKYVSDLTEILSPPEYVIFRPVPADSDANIGIVTLRGGDDPKELVENYIHTYDPYDEIIEVLDTEIVAKRQGEIVRFPIYSDLKYSSFEHEDRLIVAKIPTDVYNAYFIDWLKFAKLYDDCYNPNRLNIHKFWREYEKNHFTEMV